MKNISLGCLFKSINLGVLIGWKQELTSLNMMKPRSSRMTTEQAVLGRIKSDPSNNGSNAPRNQTQLMNNQQTSVQAIRKRRSSINVYDQPSSLNSRLRQLETDMLRLDEDRSKLFDDTHSTLAQHELRLNEVHAILKSRHDNVENYVENMKILLAAKEEFEKQAKSLNEKHDRMHDKFMHRETTISREIKLLKNKFELLEKNRQFKSILQKSNNNNLLLTSDNNDDLNGSELNESQRTKSEATSETGSFQADKKRFASSEQTRGSSSKNIRSKLPALRSIGELFAPLFRLKRAGKRIRRKSNRVSSLTSMNPSTGPTTELTTGEGSTGDEPAINNLNSGNGKKKKGGFFKNLFH